MSVQEKKFKKLSKQLSYQQSELEYVLEILKEAHWDFEDYYQEYCQANQVDLSSLNKQHATKIDELIPNTRQQHDSDGDLMLPQRIEMRDDTDMKEFKRLYREIVKVLHPDHGGDEKEFKKISDAFTEKNWSVLLEMCEKHNIKVSNHVGLNKLLIKKIEEVKGKIQREKSTYSWLLFECDGRETCKQNVVKKFLKHLFDYNY